MIKAIKGNIIVLGLSARNMKYLRDDKPIVFNLNELKLPDYYVIIFWGRDAEACKEIIEKYINPLYEKRKDDKIISMALTEGTLTMLGKGRLLKFELGNFDNMPDKEMIIFHAETEQDMFQMMKSTIDPLKTIIVSSQARHN